MKSDYITPVVVPIELEFSLNLLATLSLEGNIEDFTEGGEIDIDEW